MGIRKGQKLNFNPEGRYARGGRRSFWRELLQQAERSPGQWIRIRDDKVRDKEDHVVRQVIFNAAKKHGFTDMKVHKEYHEFGVHWFVAYDPASVIVEFSKENVA